MMSRNIFAVLVALIALPVVALGQELDPRAYSASPVGSTFVLLGVGNTSGDVVFDASTAITDVHASVTSASFSAGRVFDLAGRQASVSFGLPYAWAGVSGSVGEQQRSISRSGLGDPRLRLGLMLYGGQAMDLKTFATTRRTPILGVSLQVVAPLGQYMPDKLINIGTNRWAFKPEMGYSYPMGRWQFGVWLFADNTDFYGGHRKSQDPIASFQGHVSYTIRPGFWAAVDATQYGGGISSVDGVVNSGRQNNLRVGVTLSVPVPKVRGLTVKLAYSDGAVVRVGSDFSSVGMTFQYAWLAD
jgi:Putative MetA-pathway of phenol degradation